MRDRDTIYALSSAAGRAGIAVLRASGPQAGAALEALSGEALPPPRMASLRTFHDASGEIDRGLALWFPGPASFTGEDCAEFHVHGGRAVVDAMLAALAAQPGLRPAEPGEFTRRAVENGKMDLTAAEALADLIDAETQGQRRQALRQYEGALFALYEDWRARLIRASAWAEASIDFSDEELPDGVLAETNTVLNKIADEIQNHLSDSSSGELVREGVHSTVIGLPNAGKSSLINALAKRDVAIVSETPGTTRDVIEVRLDLGGYLVTIADTAGLRASPDAIEQEGVRRALARAEEADLVLLLLDGSDPHTDLAELPRADLVVWNKADLPWPHPREGSRLSLKTGEGLSALLETLTAKVKALVERQTDSPPLTRARHRHALEEALAALRRAVQAGESELMAEDIRLALRALGRITGRVDIEDVLDVVFRDFCIGK
ncbi:MAG TPA: tRNA uridine-5-carboxymethylaminomethyl(34) synthesis GTPase MnmE [Rhizomicrobium sp.]|nr:tRNA uridine-5-carboxymethylaminomethyl(34) synthesis GTPase MnmE [Rhizomicrobium sp.]